MKILEQLSLLESIAEHKQKGWTGIASVLNKQPSEVEREYLVISKQQSTDLDQITLEQLKKLQKSLYDKRLNSLSSALATLERKYQELEQAESPTLSNAATSGITIASQVVSHVPGHIQGQIPGQIVGQVGRSTVPAQPNASSNARTDVSSNARTDASRQKPPSNATPRKHAYSESTRVHVEHDTPSKRSERTNYTDTDMDDSETPSEKKRPRQQDKWKKTAFMIWQKMVDHRLGNSFMKLVKDKDYTKIIKRPMCLEQIKSRIRDGTIKNPSELHRDMLLMVSNAVMYNSRDSEIDEMALEMMHYIDAELHNLLLHHQ